MSVFDDRSSTSSARIGELIGVLPTENVGSACVYATGSIARGEANEHSDLDLFIIDTADESQGELTIGHLESTLLKADLIQASRVAGFPRFSGDGIHLQVHTLSDVVRRMGSPADDYTNTFTARLLLVLESRLIANEAAHVRATEAIIEAYWADYPQNSDSFLPVFLVNDVIRYWKTLCLNYESGRLGGIPSGYDAVKWKNRNQLRNVKLKFSRLWTCHATVAYLLWKTANGAPVRPADMQEMMSLTPYERMSAVKDGSGESDVVQTAIDNYAWFLETFSGSKDDSLRIVSDKPQWIDARARGAGFAESMKCVLFALGDESALFRFLLV